jgi:hypothetical protein
MAVEFIRAEFGLESGMNLRPLNLVHLSQTQWSDSPSRRTEMAVQAIVTNGLEAYLPVLRALLRRDGQADEANLT